MNDSLQPVPSFTSKSKHTEQEINEGEIESYFSFLAGVAGEREIFTYAFFDIESAGILPKFGRRHGTVKEIFSQIDELQDAGKLFTLHTVLNRTNLKGAKSKDIVSCRCLVADIDRVIEITEVKEILKNYSPGMIVESSPGKYHFYWRVDTAIGLESWSTFETGLAQLLMGDRNLAQVSHTIRVPGVERHKNGTACMPRIMFLDPGAVELTYDGVLERFPGIVEAAETGREETKKQRASVNRALREGKRGVRPDKITPASEQGRNSFLYAYLREWLRSADAPVDRGELEIEAQAVNGSFTEALGADEIKIILDKVHPKGELARQQRAEKIEKRKCAIREAIGGESAESSSVVLSEKELSLEEGKVNGKGGTNGNGSHSTQSAVAPAALGTGFAYDLVSDAELRLAPYSDLGILRRTIQKFGSRMLSTSNIVYAFDVAGGVWRNQNRLKDLVGSFVSDVTQDMVTEEGFIDAFCMTDDGAVSEKLVRQARAKFLSNYTLSSSVTRVCTSKDIARVDIGAFDSDPEKLFLANGVLSLHDLTLRPPLAADLLLRRSAARWEGLEAQCAGWTELLTEIFADNEEPSEIINFLQDIFGYTLSGHMDVQKIYIHYGGGSNGKSKVLSALASLMGDYGTLMGCSTLSRGKNAVAKELERIGAKMEGKRLVIVDDLDTATQWNEGLVKMITGRKIIARNLYEEERDIPNRAKFHIGCNTAPEPEGENFGLLRRLCIIPYLREFSPDDQKEAEITQMIERELPGILAWAVKGYLRVKERGMRFPEEVQQSLREYRQEHFSLESVLKELYAAPDSLQAGGKEPESIPVEMIVNEVRGYLQSVHDPKALADRINTRALGKTLNSLFRVDKLRVREAKSLNKSSFYRLVRIKTLGDMLED